MIHAEKSKIDRIIKIGKQLSETDLELLGHWGKYACIVCSGYVEYALRFSLQTYVKQKASPEVLCYVNKGLDGVQNPKAEKLISTLYCFSKVWGQNIEEFFEKNPASKSAIDSLMANRHLIAHGRPCSISLRQVEGYFLEANIAVDFVDNLINP